MQVLTRMDTRAASLGAMADMPLPRQPVAHPRTTPAAPAPARAVAMRVRLAPVGAVLAGAALAALLAPALPRAALDAEVATLVAGMAAIKGVLVAAGCALAAWRFGHPLDRATRTGYLAGLALAAAATALLAVPVLLVPAALAFHAGEAVFLLTAWRDTRERSVPPRA
jgi:hypothetical protein